VFESGAVVNYSANVASTGPATLWAGEWLIECEKGAIEWTGRADGTTAQDSLTIHELGGVSRTVDLPAMPLFDRLGSIQEFASCLREGRRSSIDAESNLPSLALARTAVRSSAEGSTLDPRSLLAEAAGVPTGVR